MNDQIQSLKQKVIEAASNPSFIHHEWFVERHLNIVEKIALEICEKYTDANKDIILGLVWVHDYAKIIDKSKQHDIEFARSVISPLLTLCGFDGEYSKILIEYYEIFESKLIVDLHSAPIEVKIASCADASSHFFGNFYSIYWKENAGMTDNELSESNMNKLKKDWNRKIVLPEVKEVLQKYFDVFATQFDINKDKFLNL